MNPEQWQKVENLFHAALKIQSEQRIAFLQNACQGDLNLLNQVQKFINAHEQADDFIQKPVFADAVEILSDQTETSSVIGKQFGAYKIIKEIGRGGMGAVFLAERADREFEKRAAVKIIKRGMDTDKVLRRFRTERQILASLEHPNIARLLDGGTTEDGLPYFVMEYIEGFSIIEFANADKLSINERLELFRQVCGAIGFAHQRLVVHRDIKPSNILVTNDGIPKLLDFGIAKLMNPDRIGKETVPTAPGLRLMTPEYASPEQILGRQVTTLSDIYSLGVILYELLTGHSPYNLKENTPFEIIDFIKTKEPIKPSERAFETRKQKDAQTRKKVGKKEINSKSQIPNYKSLQGDLDNVILKAMRKEPDDRYASVGQFSEDIRRYLVGLPVIARPLNFKERFVKFARRNKIAVGLTAVIFLTLLGGIATTTWQSVRANRQKELAEKRFNEIRKFARTVLFDYHDAIKDLPGSTPVRERLVRDSLEYLDNLATETNNDSSLQLELALAYERIGDVQGGTLQANLGDTKGAIESYRKALKISQTPPIANLPTAETRSVIASCGKKLGSLLWETGDLKGALEEIRKSQKMYEELTAENPDEFNYRYEYAASFDRIGQILQEQGEYENVRQNYEQNLEKLRTFSPAEQESDKLRRSFSVVYEHLGGFYLQTGNYEKALENNTRALEIRRRLAAEFPLNADFQRTVSVSFYNQGEILSKLSRYQLALESYKKNVEIAQNLFAKDPNNEQYRGDMAYGLIRIGDMLTQLNDNHQALTSYRNSQTIRAADVKADPPNLWKRASLIEAHAKISKILAKTQQTKATKNECELTFSLMEKTEVAPDNALIRGFFAATFMDLGEAFSMLKPPLQQPKCEMYKKSLDIWQDMKNRGILSNSDTEKFDVAMREIKTCQNSANY